MEKNILPLELQDIQGPTSKEECIKMATTLLEPKTHPEKYQRSLVHAFFKKNILSFSKDEITTIISIPYFENKYKKYKDEILSYCIKEKLPFAFLPENLYDEKITLDTRIKYVEILNKSNEESQLTEIAYKYCFSNNDPVKKVFNSTEYHSDALVSAITKENPEYILDVKSWSDEKKCSWITKDKKNIRIIANRTSPRKHELLSLPVRQCLYKHLIEIFIEEPATNAAERNSQYSYFINFPGIDLMRYAKKYYPNFFKSMLQEEYTVDINKSTYTLNAAQYLLSYKVYEFLENVEEIFGEFTQFLKNDIKESFGICSKPINYIDFALRTNKFNILALSSLSEEQTVENKSLMVGAAFINMNLHYVSKNNSYREFPNKCLIPWYKKIINEAPDDQINNYATEIKKLETVDESFKKEVESLQHVRNLHKQLSEKPNERKKIKI